MFKKLFTIVAVLSLIVVTDAMAQWTPVVAKIRQTTEILREGKAMQTETKEGFYLRQHDGSTLTHWTMLNGSEMQGTGDLTNNKTLQSYMLDYKTKTARQSRFTLAEPIPTNIYAKVASLGRDTVAGVSCKLIPVKIQILHGPLQQAGQACVSDEYGLLLKQETRITRDDGSVVHVVLEMHNVALNAEPNPKEFEIEGVFDVSKPAQTSTPTPPGSGT